MTASRAETTIRTRAGHPLSTRLLVQRYVSTNVAWALPYVAVLIGIFVSSLHIITGSTGMPVLMVGTLLMTLPATLLLVGAPIRRRRDEHRILLLVLLSSVFVRYIYALTNPFLSGTDAPFHYFLTMQVAHGHWPRDQALSQALPLLYLLFGTSARLTGLSVQWLVTWVPPLINLGTILLFYLFLRTYARPRVALIAAYIYAWEYTSFYFGYEFRTQSLAIALFAAFLTLRRFAMNAPLSQCVLAVIVSTIALLAIALTAVVSSLLVALLLAALVAGTRIDRQRHAASRLVITPLTSVLILVVLLAYLVYVSNAWNSAIPYLWAVLKSTLAFERAHDSSLKGVYVAGYGPYVSALQWVGRLVFIVGLMLHTRSLFTRSRSVHAPPVLATWVLLALVSVATPLGSVLSPGRYFQFLSPFFGLYIGVMLVYLIHRADRGRWRATVRVMVAVSLSLWSISAVLKLPASLIRAQGHFAAVPARIDWGVVGPTRHAMRMYPAHRYLLCADATFAASSFALTGHQAFEMTTDEPSLMRCIRKAEQSRPEQGVVVGMHTSITGTLSARLREQGFKSVPHLRTVEVLVHSQAESHGPARPPTRSFRVSPHRGHRAYATQGTGPLAAHRRAH